MIEAIHRREKKDMGRQDKFRAEFRTMIRERNSRNREGILLETSGMPHEMFLYVLSPIRSCNVFWSNGKAGSKYTQSAAKMISGCCGRATGTDPPQSYIDADTFELRPLRVMFRFMSSNMGT